MYYGSNAHSSDIQPGPTERLLICQAKLLWGKRKAWAPGSLPAAKGGMLLLGGIPSGDWLAGKRLSRKGQRLLVAWSSFFLQYLRVCL